MLGWAGGGESKKCKPIPTPPRGVRLKSRPIPAPPPLQGKENPHGVKQGGAGQAGRGKIAIPKLHVLILRFYYKMHSYEETW